MKIAIFILLFDSFLMMMNDMNSSEIIKNQSEQIHTLQAQVFVYQSEINTYQKRCEQYMQAYEATLSPMPTFKYPRIDAKNTTK